MEKIFVEKHETTANVIKHIKASEGDVVMLVIPTDSKFRTIASFRSLKKNSSTLGKGIIIESVDEKVLSLAGAANLEAIHPFLSSRTNKSLADIIPVPKMLKRSAPSVAAVSTKEKKAKGKAKPMVLKVKEVESDTSAIPVKSRAKTKLPFRYIVPAAVLAIVILGALAVNVFFTKAEIEINLERREWSLEHSFNASTSVPRNGGSGFTIPGQLLRQQKNLAQVFPASGRSQVNQKATAKITIYNAYGTESQRLVKDTRFMAPDGKIFRLEADTLVPGATRQDGKLVPSSIKALAIADQAGPAYNIGPISKMTIPGFQGSDKYNGFYGVMEEKAKGGFIGERQIPTDEDIRLAEEKANETFKGAFENSFLTTPPEGLKIIEGASELRILKVTVDRNTDESGNFTVFGEAEFRSVAFREDDIKKLLNEKAAKDYPGTKFESLFINYGKVSPNFTDGQMIFDVVAKGVLIPDFDPSNFKSQVLGRSEGEVNSLVLDIPHLKNAKVRILPFWTKKIPDDVRKVEVTVK